jgi:hypothetical protein
VKYYWDDQAEEKMDGACSTHEIKEKCVYSSYGKPEGKRPLEIHRHKWEDNIKVDLTGIKFEGLDLLCLVSENRDKCTELVDFSEHAMDVRAAGI